MPTSDYPKVKLPLGRVSLEDPYPVWFLDPRGVIHTANLLAFWLWEAIRLGETIQLGALLDISVFNILTANLKRIPVDQNSKFYEKKSAVVKRMDAGLRSPLYASFIAAMEADPKLKQIFEQTSPNPENEWEYLLRITPPGALGSTKLLEFEVTIYRLVGDDGLLCVYHPMPAIMPLIEKQYSLLIKTYGEKAYIQPEQIEQNRLERIQLPPTLALSTMTSPSPDYYPALNHDVLWNITENNEAHVLLLGESSVGKHFFEMVFSPPFRQRGPLHESSAPRAIRYFDILTAEFQGENNPLHAEYEQVMKRLLQLQDFQRLLELSRKIPIHINLPEDLETPFYTCRVFLPWPLSDDITLQFRSMARLIHKDSPDHVDREHDLWTLALVPENYETETALILLYLDYASSVPVTIGDITLRQLLWGLALMKTVEEGIMRDEVNMQWQPAAAFKRFSNELDRKFSKLTENTTEDVITQLRVILETLDRKGILDKETALTMLINFVSNKFHLSKLKELFTTELKILRRTEEHSRETGVPRRITDGDQQTDQEMLVNNSAEVEVGAFHNNELKTIVFDDEEEYVRFTDYVFEEFGGEGLAFTDVPIMASVRVTPRLLEQTRVRFALSPLSNIDIARAQAQNKDRRPQH